MPRRITEKSVHGRRKLIGEGDRAKVYFYKDGKLKGLVGRIPKSSIPFAPFWPPNSLKHQFLRFRAHQIAYLLFPEWNIYPKKFLAEDNQIISKLLPRSDKNIRMNGHRRAVERAKETTIPKEAKRPFLEMRKAGLEVHGGPENVSVVNGRPTFFAIEGMDIKTIRAYLDTNQSKFQRVRFNAIQRALNDYERVNKLNELDINEEFGLI